MGVILNIVHLKKKNNKPCQSTTRSPKQAPSRNFLVGMAVKVSKC